VRVVGIEHDPVAQVCGGRSRSCPSHSAGPHTVPSATGAHVPSLPATAHELHFAQAATPQQKPSVQRPLMHWLPTVQAVPFGFRFVHE